MSVADLTKDLENLSVSAINKKYKVGVVKEVAKTRGLDTKQKKNDLLKQLKGKKVVKKPVKKPTKNPVKKKVVKKKNGRKPALPKEVEDIVLDFKKQLEEIRFVETKTGKFEPPVGRTIREKVVKVLETDKKGQPTEMETRVVSIKDKQGNIRKITRGERHLLVRKKRSKKFELTRFWSESAGGWEFPLQDQIYKPVQE